MKKGRTTIHDIARILKVDSSTVSRALSDSARVKQETKDRIKEAAHELGYQVNSQAANLRKRRTNTIGLIVPRISRYFFSSAIAGIEQVAYDSGYNVIIGQSLEKIDREINLVNTLVGSRVDGVIISVSMETTDIKHLLQFEANEIPLVFFDRFCKGVNADKVVINDSEAAYRATENLILNGCSRIAHFAGPQTLNIYKDRLKGYIKALRNYQLPVDEDLILYSKLMKPDGVSCVQQLLHLQQPPDGIFSANDTAAIGALQYLKQQGYSIPKDIAMVGFSNEPMSSVVDPSLTTIDQSGIEMGAAAAKLLLKRIASGWPVVTRRTTRKLQATLLVRESSQQANTNGSAQTKSMAQ